MTCVSCQGDWCWLCGREMDPDHYDTNNLFGCPGGQFREAPEFVSPCSYNVWAPCDRFAVVGRALGLCMQLLIIMLILCIAIGCLIPAAVAFLVTFVVSAAIRCREDYFEPAAVCGTCVFAIVFTPIIVLFQLVYFFVAVSAVPLVLPFYYNSLCFSGQSITDEYSFKFTYFCFPFKCSLYLISFLFPDDDD